MTPRWLTFAPRVAGAAAAVVGAVVLAGWAADSGALRSAIPGLPATRANTAICLLLLGGALWQLGSPRRRARLDRLARLAAGAAGVVALLTLCEYLARVDLGIDELLFDDPARIASPGRISPQTASALIVLSVALLLPRARLATTKQACAAAAAIIACAALAGHVFEVTGSYGIADLTAMGLPGALGVLALAVGVFFLDPSRGAAGLVVQQTAGGRVARVLLPAALLIPALLGVGLFVPETRGLLSDGVAASLFVVASMVAGATLVLLTARRLHALDLEARATEARSRVLVEHAADGIVVLDVERGTFVQANLQAMRLFGMSEGSLLASSPTELSPELQPDGRRSEDAARDHIAAALAGETPAFEWVHRAANGSDVLCEVRLVRLPDPERLLVRGSLTDIRERRRAETELLVVETERAELAERARAAAAIEAAKVAAERAATRIAWLQEVTAALSQAVSREDIANTVLESALPALGASSGAIHFVDQPGRSLALAAEGASDSGDDGSPGPSATTHAAPREVFRERTPIFLESLTDVEDRHPHLATLLVGTEGAAAVLPLLRGSDTLGILVIGFAEPHAFTREDRALAVTLAELCAQALERARLYEQERRISLSLQHSLLGGLPRSVPGTDVAARYRPGVHELEVGGDWYQVIPLADGRLAFSVGDVVGRGLEAASAMGQLRSAIAALTAATANPAEVLEALDRLAAQVEGAQLATVVYAVLDPPSGELAYGCAGHLPPLVVLPDGRFWFLEEGRTTPLGASPDTLPVGARTTLPPEARLLLYTDGLVERRTSSLEAGLARLGEVAASACADDPDGLCDRVLAEMLKGERRRDDVALLSVARLPDCVLARRAPATPDALSSLRRDLRAALVTLGISAETCADLVLASGEALSNAVEHARPDGDPGEVLLELRRSGEHELSLKVRDFGVWSEEPADADRGRGLAIMRALADDVEIDHHAAGTTVVIRKRVETAGSLSGTR